MRPFKRFFAILLCVSLLIPAFSTETFAASEDYRGWSQSDSRWGSMVMGTDQNASVADYGCTSVSITKLLRQSGAVGKGYTPRDYVNHMNTIGGYNDNGEIIWKKATKPGIGLEYQQMIEYSSTSAVVKNAVDYVEKGYYVIIHGTAEYRVNGEIKRGPHFCPVDNTKTLSNGYLTIMNSWKSTSNNINKKYDSVFTKLDRIYLFKASGTIKYSKVSSGNYYLKNNYRGTYVTVKEGVDSSKQPVILSEFDGGKAMQLELTYSSAGSTFRPLCCDTRLLEPKRDEDAVTSGDTLYIMNVSTKRASNQGWSFQKVDDGYVIHNMSNPDCVLSAVNGELKMQTYEKGKATQIWSLIPVEEAADPDHSYGDPFFSWTADLSEATATRVCSCGNEISSICTLTWDDSQPGKIAITATAELDGDICTETQTITASGENGIVTVTLPWEVPGLQIMAAAYSDAGQMIACTLPEQSEGAAIQTFPFSGENVRLFFLDEEYTPLFPAMTLP